MWLTVRQLPIKSAWRDGSLALRDFSPSNKHCIHLSVTTQPISLASFLQCPHLHQSRYPILICNKSAFEAWICLAFFWWLSFQSIFPILICNKKTWEALNFYFSSKLQLEQNIYYCRLELITSATKMRIAGLRSFIF